MKKVLSVLGNIFTVVLLVFAITMTTMVILSTRSEDRIPSLFGYAIMNVLTDSMEGEDGFYVGDLIVVRKVEREEANNLKVGDVITFRRSINKELMIETHRITENNVLVNTDDFSNIEHEVVDGVWKHGGVSYYLTKGDNTDGVDFDVDIGALEYSSQDNIIGVWEGTRIPKLGSALSFLQSQMGFMFCIVLPIALFFIYQLYVFIVTIAAKKREDTLAAVSDKTEELKAAAIAEYLAKQSGEQGSPAPAEKKEPEPAAETAPAVSEEEKAKIIAEYMAKQAEAMRNQEK